MELQEGTCIREGTMVNFFDIWGLYSIILANRNVYEYGRMDYSILNLQFIPK